MRNLSKLIIESSVLSIDEASSSGGVDFSKLTDDQKRHLQEELNNTYMKSIDSVYEQTIKRFKNLSTVKFKSNSGFKYDYYRKKMVYITGGFGNYVYGTNKYGNDPKQQCKGIDDFCKDVRAFVLQFNKNISQKNKGFYVLAEDEEENSVDTYCKNMKQIIMQYGKSASNSLYLKVLAPDNLVKKLVPSTEQINDIMNKKYLALYDQYANFLLKPRKMSGNFWPAYISDISKICGISSDKLNQIVAKNIRPTMKQNFNNYHDEDGDTRFEKQIQSLGEYMEIYSIYSDDIIFSFKDKKMHWINYEHKEEYVFYNNFPYSTKEFENIIYMDHPSRKSIKELFMKYDAKKGYHILG